MWQFLGPFLGTWLAPKGQGHDSIGNVVTCFVQSLGVEYAGFISPLYNMMLAICYVLMVKYNWTEDKFDRYKWWFYIPPLIVLLPQIITLIIYGGGNFGNPYCGLSTTYPYGCHVYPGSCERGETLAQKLWRTNYILIIYCWEPFLGTIIVLTCMGILYHSVLQQEKANEKYIFNLQQAKTSGTAEQATKETVKTTTPATTCQPPEPPSETFAAAATAAVTTAVAITNTGPPLEASLTGAVDATAIASESPGLAGGAVHPPTTTTTTIAKEERKRESTRKLSRQVAWQGIFYILGFLIVQVVGLITLIVWIARIVNPANNNSGNNFFDDRIAMATAWLLPSQAIWNCLVYFRPKIVSYITSKRQQEGG